MCVDWTWKTVWVVILIKFIFVKLIILMCIGTVWYRFSMGSVIKLILNKL